MLIRYASLFFFCFLLAHLANAIEILPCDGTKPICEKIKTTKVGKVASRVPILQGPSNSKNIRLVIAIPKARKLQAYFFPLKKVEYSLKALPEFPVDPYGVVHQVQVSSETQLPKMRIALVNDEQEIVDMREFEPLIETLKNQKIMIGSCLDDSYMPEAEKIWRQIEKQTPDAIFLIGDNVYVDLENGKPVKSVTPEVLRRRYWNTRQKLTLFYFKRLIPTFSIWDDHDYGLNNSDKTFEHALISTSLFETFFGLKDNPAIERGPGMSSVMSLGAQRYIFLDDRSFRDTLSHFGETQEAWVWGHLQKAQPTFLISGDQFFGGYHKFESYEGNHPVSWKAFIEKLKTMPSQVVFISGDRHLSELMKIEKDILNYTTVEWTVSPVHGKTFPREEGKYPNARMVELVTGEWNYGLLKTATLALDLEVYGLGKKRFYHKKLQWDKNGIQ